VGAESLAAIPLGYLAAAESEDGLDAESLRHAEEAFNIAKGTGLTAHICVTSTILGDLYSRSGRTDAARSIWEEGLGGLRRTHVQTHFMIPGLVKLGRLTWQAEDRDCARSLLLEGLELGRRMSRYELARGLETMVEIADGEGKPESALQLAGAAATLRDAMGAPLWPSERRRLDPIIRDARQCLSEAAADAAWMRGWTSPVDVTIGLATDLLKERSLGA
jgi:hypothetical protein